MWSRAHGCSSAGIKEDPAPTLCTMGSSKEWPQALKLEMIDAHKAGEGYKKIAMRFHVPVSSVRNVIKKWKLTGSVEVKKRSGRPRKISDTTAPTIATKAGQNSRVTAKLLQEDLAHSGVVVHCSTVKRYLRKYSKSSSSMSAPQKDPAEAAEEWAQHWLHGGFYVPTVTKMLEINIDKVVDGRSGVKFFVPLCGKTADMKWLAEMGHSVVGVERSQNAVRQFFEENNMSYTEEFVPKIPGAKVFQNMDKTLSLYQCDIYSFNSSFEGQFDAIWDRGALVVINPKEREKYAALIISLMAPGCRYLLDTMLYDPKRYAGPPFLVTDEQVQNLFGSDCDIESLQEEDALTEEWADSGLDSLTEKVHLLVLKS